MGTWVVGKNPSAPLPYPLEPSTHTPGWQEPIISHGQSSNHRCVFLAIQNLTLHERINFVQGLDYCKDTVDSLQKNLFQSRFSSSFTFP